MQFRTEFSEFEKFLLGFELACVNKEYMPVPLKVTFAKEMMGFLPWEEEERELFTPQDFNKRECYVMAARNIHDEYSIFIRRSQTDQAHAFDPNMGYITFVFEAEKFLYILENASKQNKLIMFRNAVLPSITEANQFLALVDNSTTISQRDRNRAWTWMQQKVKGRNI